MPNTPSEERLRVLPRTIRTLIETTPLLPGEERKNFIDLFLELEFSPDGEPKTAAEYVMVFEATKLIFNMQRLERRRAQLVEHLRPAAVLTMHIRATKDGIAEPGSIAYSAAKTDTQAYFGSEEGRKKSMDSFRRAGYSQDSVDTESYLQAHPLIIAIERQIIVAERLLISFLKELDHRYVRRAEEIRRAAARALARGRANTAQNNGAV